MSFVTTPPAMLAFAARDLQSFGPAVVAGSVVMARPRPGGYPPAAVPPPSPAYPVPAGFPPPAPGYTPAIVYLPTNGHAPAAV